MAIIKKIDVPSGVTAPVEPQARKGLSQLFGDLGQLDDDAFYAALRERFASKDSAPRPLIEGEHFGGKAI